MNWVRYFSQKLIWRLVNAHIVHKIAWTEGDKNNLDMFWRTPTGRKLFEALRQVIASTTFKAVYHESVSDNARARGMQDVLALLHWYRAFPEGESDLYEPDELEEETPDLPPIDGRRYGFSGGHSAIGSSK